MWPEIYYLLKKKRRYAPFFEWPMDKRQREIQVASHLIQSLGTAGDTPFLNPRLHDPDPPDVVADLQSGGVCAIEITELVDGNLASTREHISGNPRMWEPGELSREIASILSFKDSRTFHGGPYDATVVCLFTGEPLLSFDMATMELTDIIYGPYINITDAYLLFPYDEMAARCPIVELKVVA